MPSFRSIGCLLAGVQAAVRSGSDINSDYRPKAGKAPNQWPPRIHPMMTFISSPSHYLGMNKRRYNSAGRNFRDGSYHYDLAHTYGRTVIPFHTSDEGLTVVRNKDVVTPKGYPMSEWCPPQKLGDLRNTVLFIEAMEFSAMVVCSFHALLLNIHRSRVSQILWAVRPIESLIGALAGGYSEKDIFWKTKTRSFALGEMEITTELALGRLTQQSRPYAFSASRASRLKFYGTSEYVEWSTNRIDIPYWAFWYIVQLLTNLPLNAFILYMTVEFLPYFFPRMTAKIPGFSFSGKKTKKIPFKVQEAVNVLELIPNLFMMVDASLGASIYGFSTFKVNPWGSLAGPSGVFFNLWYKLMGMCTTLLMTFMWMNESAAAAKMKAAAPILQTYGKTIKFGGFFWFFLECNIWRANAYLYGAITPLLSVFFLLFTLVPIVSLAISLFFQFEAGKVASSLGGNDDNAALVEFRNKMVLNLARGGLVELIGILWILVISGIPSMTSCKGVGIISMTISWFRNGVSYFQIVSIEPAAAAKARKMKKKKALAGITSRVSMTSTSSMSSTSDSSESMVSSSSSDSSGSTARSTAMSTTA